MVLPLWILAAVVQLYAWSRVFPFAFQPGRTPTRHERPVSVIVCFRNEAATLEQCLTAILEQDHPAFELLAVDDNSTDGSAEIVRRLQRRHSRLYLLQPGPTRPGKKDALTYGVEAARHELLLLTDADCAPASREWLGTMTAPLTEGYDLVLGASPYRPEPGALSIWQRFEATSTALYYLGLARHGLPYMGVGRNIAYHRSFFTAAGGMAAHADLPGGDDDLLVNAHASTAITHTVTDPRAWTISEPTPDWRTYLRQKRRHQSVGLRYRPATQAALLGVGVSHGLFFLLGLYLLFTPYAPVALFGYGLRFSLLYPAYTRQPVAKFLGADTGADQTEGIPATLQLMVADALLAPFYLFLSVATVLPAGRW